VFSNAEMRALSRYLSAIYGDEEIDDEDDGVPDNPFVDGDSLLERLDELSCEKAPNIPLTRLC